MTGRDVPIDLEVRAPRAIIDGVERAATLHIGGGRILAIGDASRAAGSDPVPVLQLGADEVLLPGFVDTHVHINEPGRTQWEGFASATRAAAAGGVTTLIDMPLNSLPPTTTVAGLRAKEAAAAGTLWVDVGLWGGAIPGNLDDLAPLHEAGVFGFKSFLSDSGVPEFPPVDVRQLRENLTVLAQRDALLLVHAEDPATLAEAATTAPGGGDPRSYRQFLRSRPRVGEQRAIEEVIRALRETGGRAHILHVADADALATIAAARAEGLALTAETCSHYLTFCAEEIPDAQPAFKCCPPIRERDSREGLWRGLAEGVLDIVVSDHSPSEPSLKHFDSGDVERAWGGIAGVQFSVSAVWTGAHARGYRLSDLVRWMATGPADLVGLRHKGRLRVGADADFVVFAPDQEFEVGQHPILHRHPATPYRGRRLRGAVRSTWLRGEPVGEQANGHLLRRGEA